MAYLHGTVIDVESAEVSQNGNWYTRGILEDNEKILHDFVIFWKDSTLIKIIRERDVIDLVGKKDRTEGTFKANYIRDFKTKTYLQPNSDLADKTYRGDDAINGKAPIEYAMDILGAKLVNDEIRKLAPSYSLIFENKETLSQYKALKEELIRIAKLVELEQTI